jgi:predicted SAM-dependent methyltransferase
MTKINIGCGKSPTLNWKNYDNSPSIKLAKYHFLAKLLKKLKLINSPQFELINFYKQNKVFFANASKSIPEPSNSVSIIYSSHMFEHLDKREATQFLAECYRVLKPNGIIRLAIPNIEIPVSEYLKNKDADVFIESTHLCLDRPRTFREILKFLLVGNRNHQWMYDGKSLSKKIASCGFVDVKIQPPGQTSILNYGALDLSEREHQSVYVEAKKEA